MSRSVALPPEMQAAKAAFKQLVRAFGGQEAAAVETGVRQQKISDMGLANVPDFPTLDLIDKLEERTEGTAEWPLVTRWLARRRGFALVRLPDGQPDEAGLLQAIMEITKELGETAARISEGLADGEMSGREAKRALVELDELQTACAALRVKLHALAEGP